MRSFHADIAAAKTASDRGLEVVMSETNSASCSGFAGLSDSFGVAMWLIDWALTLAYRDFSSARLHVGGQSAFYNVRPSLYCRILGGGN
jgi:hypothetical protein